jgi:hypothetical protein
MRIESKLSQSSGVQRLLDLFGHATVVKMLAIDAFLNEKTNTSHELDDFDKRGFHVSGLGRLCTI